RERGDVERRPAAVYGDPRRFAGLPLVDDVDRVARAGGVGGHVQLRRVELAAVRRVLAERVEARGHALGFARVTPDLLALLERAALLDAYAALVDEPGIARIAVRRIRAVGDDVQLPALEERSVGPTVGAPVGRERRVHPLLLGPRVLPWLGLTVDVVVRAA